MNVKIQSKRKKNCPHGTRKRTKGRIQQTQLGSPPMVMVGFRVLITMLKLMHLPIIQKVSLLIGISDSICSNKEWFETYKKKEGGEVIMGDDSICRLKGTSTINVKMHDDIMKTLGIIRYIPKLLKNLISLGIFDKSGYTFKANERKLIISKGSLVIMNGDIKLNCLYRLCWMTVISGATVFTSNDSDDETQL